MHQGHNIPWDLISSNFKFVRDDKGFTPPFTGLVSLNKPNAPKELKHLVKKFTQTILTFSETERKKYPQTFTPLLTGNLFSDELRDRYPEYLNKNNQRVEYWIERAHKRYGGALPVSMRYDTSDGDLADVVKVLLYENEMASLLMLAQHPRVPIKGLGYLTWGHNSGFSRVMEEALRSYMFFNTATVTGILDNGGYLEMPEYRSLISEVASFMDYPAQQTPHRVFLQECGMLGSYESVAHRRVGKDMVVHEDYGRLREYLKTLFALMYRYDILLRECGSDPEWEGELAHSFPLREVVKVEWDPKEVKWKLA